MRLDNNQQVFLELLKAGLWEKEARLLQFKDIDFKEIYKLAQEQCVVGLVAAGLEHVVDMKPPKEVLLKFIGLTLQLEERNRAMNSFIGVLVDKMRKAGIYTLLVKGQGIAQCYERPLWRASGDVDLLLSEEDYIKARDYLVPLSSFQKKEGRYSKHLGLSIFEPLSEQEATVPAKSWYVELHGKLRTGLAARVDELVDAVQKEEPYSGNVRTWKNGEYTVFLPAPDNDVIFVFTHFLKHFYREDITIRQICDWSRLLWTCRDKVNVGLLESRIKKAGLMKEWKAFAALAVDYLGMPVDAMPLYDERFKGKGSRLIDFILKGYSGNKVKDTWEIAKIFPCKTFRYLPSIFLNVNWLKIKERLLSK